MVCGYALVDVFVQQEAYYAYPAKISQQMYQYILIASDTDEL